MHKYFFSVLLLVAVNCYAQQEEDVDPTKPTLPQSVDEDYGDSANSHGVYLNGIIERSGEFSVILNGKIMHQENDIQGYKIIEITQNSVKLKPNSSDSASSNSKEIVELKLSNLNFKQPHINSR